MGAVTTMKLKPLRDPAEVRLEPLEKDPKYAAAQRELAAIDERIAEADHRRNVARARTRGQKPTRSVLERAKALVAGGQVVASTPEAELSAAEEELAILTAARMKLFEQLEQIRGELGYAANLAFAQIDAEAARQILAAMGAIFDSLEAMRVARGRLHGGGYGVSETALVPLYLPAIALASQFGDPGRSGTLAWNFRQQLEQRGITV